jgi:hypothetical protein
MAEFDRLLQRAKELGIPTDSGVYKPRSEAFTQLQITEWELHRRIKEEERHQREHRLWIVAVVAAAASLASALAAWFAHS